MGATYRDGQRIDIRIRTIAEFAANQPDVPTASGVDVAKLTAGDDDPFYVTLPIVPRVGMRSNNGLTYDEYLVGQIEQQIRTKRPGGIFGHVASDYEFPHPAAYWVGALRVGETLWAKSYVPPGAARDHLRYKQAVGGAISTSIFGVGSIADMDDDGSFRLENFELETVDFAPPERAALGYAAPVRVTAEMSHHENGNGGNNMPTKQEVIAQLTVADVPDNLRNQIAEQAAQKAAALRAEGSTLQKRVAQLIPIDDKAAGDVKGRLQHARAFMVDRVIAQMNGKTDDGAVDAAVNLVWPTMQPLVDAVKANGGGAAGDASADAVAEMRAEMAAMRAQAIRGRIAELAARDVQAEAIRPIVAELVAARNPATVADVDAAFDAVVKSDHVKSLLENDLIRQMGPRQTNGIKPQSGGDQTSQYINIPADDDE